MNRVSDTHVLIRQPLTAEELRKWPLMHGTDGTGSELEQMRREGLVAGRASNSQDYDRELGRTDFVFLTLASFLINYGRCSILVDSAVLERKDLGFSDQDVRVAIDCLKILVEDGRDVYCGEAKNVDGLYRIVEAQRGATSDANGEQLFARVICSPEFKTYYHQHYELAEVAFWQHVQKAYKRSLYDFFGRSNDPWLQEEIFVPKVEPELLLGYWDGSHWVEWRKASTPDVQHRLQVWIEAATNRSTQ